MTTAITITVIFIIVCGVLIRHNDLEVKEMEKEIERLRERRNEIYS